MNKSFGTTYYLLMSFYLLEKQTEYRSPKIETFEFNLLPSRMIVEWYKREDHIRPLHSGTFRRVSGYVIANH